MASKISKKVSSDDSLSLSYNKGVGRITGFKHYSTFKISPAVIEERQKFWNELFLKYSERESDEPELDIFTLKPCRKKFYEEEKTKVETIKQPMCKPLSVVQYWVNTGYLPYKELYVNKDKQLNIELSLTSEECISSSHHKSSSSSVDTAAYILSNMNTTNKVETMAIVEGAKYNSIGSFQKIQDIDIIQNKICEENNGNSNENILETNGSDEQQYAPKICEMSNHVLLQKDKNEEEYTTQAQRNICADVARDMLSGTINRHEKLIRTFYDSINRNSYIEQNLSNTKSPHVNQTYLTEESFKFEDSPTKIGHRKKLYTGRDSPVDLISMKSSNRSTISNSNKNLHPALDFECKLPKKCKISKKRRMSCFSIYNKLMNNSQFSTSNHKKRKWEKSIPKFKTINDNITKNSVIDQHLVKSGTDKYINRSLSPNVFINKQSEFNKSVNRLQKINTKEHKKLEELQSLNPVVRLTRLSKDDIAKYKRSKKIIKSINNLSTIELSRLSNQRRRRLNKMTNMKHLVVRLSRLSEYDIKKYKRLSNVALNLNSKVRLKQLSEIEIQRYTKSTNTMNNFRNLNPVVLLKRLSNFDIQKYKSANNKSTLGRSDSFSKFAQLQNGDKINNLSQLDKLTHMTSMLHAVAVTEDTASDQTTVLLCKCDNMSLGDCSTDNLSIFSKNSSQPHSISVKTRNNHMSQIKEKFHEKGEELNSEICNKKVGMTKTLAKNKIERENDKNQLKLSTNKSNLKNKRDSRKKQFTKLHSKDNSFETNSETSDINKDVLLERRNECMNKNKKKSHISFSSDEDNEFMKLVHCSEDMQKLKLRQYYKVLNEKFNSTVDKLEETRNSIIKFTVSSMNSTSLSNKLFSDSIIKDGRLKKKQENLSPVKNEKCL
ncbi:general transcriptional corepressor trfA-like isoform X2 [Bombus vosnesenskii]|uniref:General transcriptional corepressor trfA-like isoform X2 n=1 Tax=Bombus vosnesenskii TaxID=207650 RepID=A0A6J3KLD0_9HYME|nr:general transcriptional corepressor trfA-like isoform X2 [Bombus vosnesenskii]